MLGKIEQRSDKFGKLLILCDFDGTVSIKDTVNKLVRNHLSSPEWRFHVKRYLLGDIGSKAVYEAVAPLMTMTQEHLDSFVFEHAELDPGFPAFLSWARDRNIEVKIVSDGFDQTIKTLFRNHNIPEIDIYANQLELDHEGAVKISHPHANPSCGICGTCKLEVLRSFRNQYDKIIVIGDGESDRHASHEADFVLALHDLFVYCARHNLPAMRMQGFSEAPRLLSRSIKAIAYDLDGTLIDSLSEIAQSFNHMFRNLGYPEMTKDEVARRTSLSLMDFVKAFLRPDEIEIGIKMFRDYYSKIFRDQTKLMPGAMECITTLEEKVTQGVVTNKKRIFARIIAEKLDFAAKMIVIMGAEDGFKAKPAGAMIDEFIRLADARKTETIYVGDSPVDIVAAKNADIDAFAIAGPVFSAEELALHGPRRVLNGINELPEAIKAIV